MRGCLLGMFFSLLAGLATTVEPLAAQVKKHVPVAYALQDEDSNFVPDHLGEEITIKGVVTVGTGALSSRRFIINIQDETGGITIYDETLRLKVKPGDLIEVTGKVSQYNGLEELTEPKIVVSGRAEEIRPKEISLADLNSEKFSGQLVTVHGRLLEKRLTPTGIQLLLYHEGFTGAVWYSALRVLKLDASGLKIDSLISATGTASQYDTEKPYDSFYQLVPRAPQDIKVIKAPPLIEPKIAAYFFLVLLGSAGLFYLWVHTLRRRVRERTKELILEKQKYEKLVDSIDGIVWECNAQTLEFSFVSRRAEQILGYAVERWLREPTFWVDHLHPDDRKRVVDLCSKTAREGGLCEFECRMIAADGRTIWFRYVVAVVVDKGEAVKLRGLMVDITRIRQAEEVLRESEERFRLAFEKGPIGMAIVGPDYRILRANKAICEMLGYSEQELVMLTFADITHPEDLERDLRLAEQLFGGEISSYGLDKRYVRKDGKVLWGQLTATVIRDEMGKPMYGLGMVEDITGRKQVQEELEQQLRRISLLNEITRAILERQGLESIYQVVLQHLEEHLPIDFGGVYHFDPQADTLTVVARGPKSRAIAAELGVPEGCTIPVEHTGLRLSVRGQPVYLPDSSQADAPVQQALASRGLLSLVATPFVSNGEVLGIMVTARRGRDAFSRADREFLETSSKHVALALRQARLYDDLQRAYNELKETQEQIIQQERLRALGQMASGIAHDFNNTLVPILGFSDLMLTFPRILEDKEKAINYLRMINTAAKDGAGVIRRLRDFYRPRERNEVFVPIDLNELAKQAIALTEPKWKDEAQASNASIRMAADLHEIPLVDGNEGELREALVNIILNAVDAMPRGGTITIRTRLDGKYVAIEISDTGIGMSEEIRKRCMEPLFTTKDERGSGLGLAIVHGIVRRHEGTIEIESELEKGTTFIVRLPVSTQIRGKVDTKAAPAVKLERPLHILLIEDEVLVRETISDYLARSGYTLEIAANGHKGLEKFCAGSFDLVITDRAMPEMSGDELALAIKRISPNTPIIMLTGFGDLMNATDENPEVVDVVVSKPVVLSELQQAIVKLLSTPPQG